MFEFEVGDGSKSTYLKMAFRIEEKYKIKHLCTDGNKVYRHYNIGDNHHITKSETCLVDKSETIATRSIRKIKNLRVILELQIKTLLGKTSQENYLLQQEFGGFENCSFIVSL